MLGTRVSPAEAMKLALEEAKKGFGFVAPNPPVGCAILDQGGHLLSLGYHHACGEDHAEVDAVKNVTDSKKLKNAHVLVTLEPCAHQGRTPSCAKMLATLPIAKVSYAIKDPNPLVAGKGAAILEEAGIVTEELREFAPEAEEVAEIFLHNMRQKTPFVALKVATSLDGQMAFRNGQSQWITNGKAREYAQYLRGCYDAVLIGMGTFLEDNPRLNSRHPLFKDAVNKVVLLDPHGRSFQSLQDSNLLSVRKPEQIYVVVGPKVQATPNGLKGLNILPAPVTRSGHFDLSKLLPELYNEGISSLYTEGGAGVFGAFLKSGAAQRLYQFVAPCVLGAKSGLNWTSEFAIDDLSNRVSLENVRYSFYDDNVLVTGRFAT